MRRPAGPCIRQQRGTALLMLAIAVITVVLGFYLNRLNSAPSNTERSLATQRTLTLAKDALIGFAATYRDTHADESFGFLPCPDTDNDGISDSCGATDVSLAGRLPWKTLGLQPLRDSAAECLWYVVSGRAKDNPKTLALNWDTTGQLIVRDVGGAVMAGVTEHERPLAVILAANAPLPTQARTPPVAGSECSSGNAGQFLEGLGALGPGDTTITVANPDSLRNGTNNDQAQWITAREIFDRIKLRSDFKADIDGLLADIAGYLNALPPAALPVASAGNKGATGIIAGYLAANPALAQKKQNVLRNWGDNLLYAGGPAGSYTINGSPTSCRALLYFGGERTTRTVAPLNTQTRVTSLEKGDGANFGDPGMYLEVAGAATFPVNGAYGGGTQYVATSPAADLVRCINGLPSGGSATFANPGEFAAFAPTGNGVTPNPTAASGPSVSILDASGSGGGCFWYPAPVSLAGKILRSYYEFTFSYADNFAVDALAPDRGNGFSFQLVRGDLGYPTACGTESGMGVLGGADIWGSFSYIVETDVHRDAARVDPTANHTAIMFNGNLTHTAGSVTAACDGTAIGCAHTPASRFEEAPAPLAHNQRQEIHTGCNAGCSACSPASHVAPNTYARISVWGDCSECGDVALDINRTLKPPTIQRCLPVYDEMNLVHFGFTGGFRSASTLGAAPAQGVIIRSFALRSE